VLVPAHVTKLEKIFLDPLVGQVQVMLTRTWIAKTTRLEIGGQGYNKIIIFKVTYSYTNVVYGRQSLDLAVAHVLQIRVQ
jgi:hypothetical protein